MDDARIWELEESLWTGTAEQYEKLIDGDCLMVVPMPPYILGGTDAADTMGTTPRWDSVELSNRMVTRPQEGLIVVAYTAHAQKADHDDYEAHCTTVLRRLEHDEWRVIQHQQTPPLTVAAAS